MLVIVLEVETEPHLPLKYRLAISIFYSMLRRVMPSLLAKEVVEQVVNNSRNGDEFATFIYVTLEAFDLNPVEFTILVHLYAHHLQLSEGWKKGDIARVVEVLDNDIPFISYYHGQTFVVESLTHDAASGQLLLVGMSRFLSPMPAIYCEQRRAHDNPYPLCIRQNRQVNNIYSFLKTTLCQEVYPEALLKKQALNASTQREVKIRKLNPLLR